MHNLPIKKNVPTEMIILTSLVALFIFEQITNKLGQMRAFDPREKGHYKTSSDLKLDIIIGDYATCRTILELILYHHFKSYNVLFRVPSIDKKQW